MKKALKAYSAQNEYKIKFDEREELIMQKAKIYGSPLFENPEFAKKLFSLHVENDFAKKETKDINQIVSFVQESIENAQMSKD